MVSFLNHSGNDIRHDIMNLNVGGKYPNCTNNQSLKTDSIQMTINLKRSATSEHSKCWLKATAESTSITNLLFVLRGAYRLYCREGMNRGTQFSVIS